jgi:hypothetical protein
VGKLLGLGNRRRRRTAGVRFPGLLFSLRGDIKIHHLGGFFMTKAELMQEFEELQDSKGVKIEGIYYNSKKDEIENAIECLKCPDELLDKYLMLVSLKYENIGRTIAENGDFKRHSHNRLYVYNTARAILAN